MTCLPDHVHYWILESAEQAVDAGRMGRSRGICKHCLQRKEFVNSVSTTTGISLVDRR